MIRPAEPKLRALRAEIDRLNHQILELLALRARRVEAIADLKDELELAAHDPAREDEMLRGLVVDLPDPLDSQDVREIFHAIFRAGVRIHHRLAARRQDELAG
jgi:chorismate mutase